jgi:predicted RNase H-like nuclease (RuvC/YqgF family)
MSRDDLCYADQKAIIFSDWASSCEWLTDEPNSYQCTNSKHEGGGQQEHNYNYCMDCYCPLQEELEKFIEKEHPEVKLIDLKEAMEDDQALIKSLHSQLKETESKLQISEDTNGQNETVIEELKDQLKEVQDKLESYKALEVLNDWLSKQDSNLDKNDKSYMQKCFEQEQKLKELEEYLENISMAEVEQYGRASAGILKNMIIKCINRIKEQGVVGDYANDILEDIKEVLEG